MHAPTLRTARLVLRPLVLGDAPAIFTWASDPAVTPSVLWDAHRTVDDSTAFLLAVADRYAAGEPLDWGIEHHGTLVGTIGFHDRRVDHHRAEVGYTIARPWWGQGIATEAVRAVVTHGFSSLGFERIVARTRDQNVASQRVLEKAGFLREGLFPHHLMVRGEWWNLALFGIQR